MREVGHSDYNDNDIQVFNNSGISEQDNENTCSDNMGTCYGISFKSPYEIY